MFGTQGINNEKLYNFPLQTIEDIDNLEKNLANRNYFAGFFEIVSKYKPPDRTKLLKTYSTYGLVKFVDYNLLFEFNWNGMQGKIPFKKYSRLNDILYSAWRGESIDSYHAYVQNIKRQLLAVRFRINTRKSLSLKRLKIKK